MEILKVKDWIKSNGKQFTIDEVEYGEIISCIRISDKKEFILGQVISISTLWIKNKIYKIEVFIDEICEDCIHVKLAGEIADISSGDGYVSNKIPINQIMMWTTPIIMGVKTKVAMEHGIEPATI